MSDATILVVDDEELYAQAIGRALERHQLSCDLAYTCREALSLASTRRYHVILLDHRLPDDDGIRIIPLLRAHQPAAALVMMTAYQTIPNAVQAIRYGAEDYVVKETSIQPIVERVLETHHRVELRGHVTGKRAEERDGLLGTSGPVVALVEQLDQVAQSPDTTVLLVGETGSGKEVAGHYLHLRSRPARSPFVVIDCLTLPESLAESLLFGHEKGSFTGAEAPRTGAFEQAQDGTIFLDEIGDMGGIQGKLLRVLESRAFRRLGAPTQTPLRARVVAATNQDLEALVAQGRFRRDLYERLAVFPVRVPPLRERGDDIVLLANHFAGLFARKLDKELEPLGPGVAERLLEYDYPGNVRELRNIIERAVILCDDSLLEARHLPPRVLNARGGRDRAAPTIPCDFAPGVDTLGTIEERMIRQALRRTHNVRTKAARLLGISRFQLLRRLEKYGIEADPGTATQATRTTSKEGQNRS